MENSAIQKTIEFISSKLDIDFYSCIESNSMLESLKIDKIKQIEEHFVPIQNFIRESSFPEKYEELNNTFIFNKNLITSYEEKLNKCKANCLEQIHKFDSKLQFSTVKEEELYAYINHFIEEEPYNELIPIIENKEFLSELLNQRDDIELSRVLNDCIFYDRIK